MIDKIKRGASADIKEQLSWLGLKTFSDENWLDFNGKQKNIEKLRDF